MMGFLRRSRQLAFVILLLVLMSIAFRYTEVYNSLVRTDRYNTQTSQINKNRVLQMSSSPMEMVTDHSRVFEINSSAMEIAPVDQSIVLQIYSSPVEKDYDRDGMIPIHSSLEEDVNDLTNAVQNPTISFPFVEPMAEQNRKMNINYSPVEKITDKNRMLQRYSSSMEDIEGLREIKVPNADCKLFFAGKYNNLAIATRTPSQLNLDISRFLQESRNKSTSEYCPQFKSSRGYVLKPLTEEDVDFPLAYSILVFKDAEMFERLLRAIYRPQNVYCVHIDLSSEPVFQEAVRAIVSCFPNVFIPPNIINVVHGKYSVLEAELICMKQLLDHKVIWKYFINLTGQEFPLKPNEVIVKILKLFNGANNIAGTIRRRIPRRYKRAGPPPFNMTITKGSVHIIATREFVDFVFNNEIAIKFHEWVKKTHIAVETFFSCLNHNPQLGVPGAYIGEPEIFTGNYLFISRFKSWVGNFPDSYPCAGTYSHGICIFGIRDLPLLASRPELFANKFHIDYQPLAYDCLDELVYHRTVEHLLGTDTFDYSFYSNLSFVKSHV